MEGISETIRETLSSIRNSRPGRGRKLSEEVEICSSTQIGKKINGDFQKSQNIESNLLVAEFKTKLNENVEKKLSSVSSNF